MKRRSPWVAVAVAARDLADLARAYAQLEDAGCGPVPMRAVDLGAQRVTEVLTAWRDAVRVSDPAEDQWNVEA